MRHLQADLGMLPNLILASVHDNRGALGTPSGHNPCDPIMNSAEGLKMESDKLLPIGTETPWGKIEMIAYLGERYYFMVKDGVVSMMPAFMVESHDKQRSKKG